MCANQDKPKWGDLKKQLILMPQSDLIKLISELYRLLPENKIFLETRFLEDEKLVDYYKQQIKRYVAPDRPELRSQPINLKKAKQVVSHYKKASHDQMKLLDLMLYYVECGTDFACCYGDLYEEYYASLESMFEKALDLIKRLDVNETSLYDLTYRIETILKDASHTGWGYHDILSDLFEESGIKKELDYA